MTDQGWLRQLLEENKKEVDRWPPWFRTESSEEQGSENSAVVEPESENTPIVKSASTCD